MYLYIKQHIRRSRIVKNRKVVFIPYWNNRHDTCKFWSVGRILHLGWNMRNNCNVFSCQIMLKYKKNYFLSICEAETYGLIKSLVSPEKQMTVDFKILLHKIIAPLTPNHLQLCKDIINVIINWDKIYQHFWQNYVAYQ